MESQKMSEIKKVIQNYIQGIASETDEKFLISWLKQNPENRKLLFLEKDLLESLQLGSKRLNEIENQQWLELQNKISTEKFNSGRFTYMLKIAALIIISMGIGWFANYFFNSNLIKPQQVQQKSIEATKGQVKEIFLADGTHVWLNSDSKFSFPSDFSEKKREVQLSGEAFFEVTSNLGKPFFVKTGNHTVKVTGTKFNICEYPESKIIETTLVEGKVKIISGNILKDLFPGQQSSFNTESAQIRIGKTDLEIYTSWKDGRYEFKNESVAKIFQIMERWWDVEIIYSETELKNEQLSGVLRRYKSLEQHFEVIKQLVPIEYKIDNDVINISMK